MILSCHLLLVREDRPGVGKHPDPPEVLCLIVNYQPSIFDDNLTPHVACLLGETPLCQGKHPLHSSSISYYKLINRHQGVYINISPCELGTCESVTD